MGRRFRTITLAVLTVLSVSLTSPSLAVRETNNQAQPESGKKDRKASQKTLTQKKKKEKAKRKTKRTRDDREGKTADKEVFKVPFVYHPDYNFKLPHQFEQANYFTRKNYAGAIELLKTRLGISSENFYQPEGPLLKSDLIRNHIHTQDYLDKLGEDPDYVFSQFQFSKPKTKELRKIFQANKVEIASILVETQKLAAAGTVLASELASDPDGPGWAINFGGGGHHAFSDRGSGFCLVADFAAATDAFLKKTKPEIHVAIVDGDAHRGDGIADRYSENPRVHIFDVFNGYTFPFSKKVPAKKEDLGEYDFPLNPATPETSDEAYLKIFETFLPKMLDENPSIGILYYNAGTDPYEHDEMKLMKITREGLIKRDEIVFREARSRGIAIFAALSGGYSIDMPENVASSTMNLITKGIIQILNMPNTPNNTQEKDPPSRTKGVKRISPRRIGGTPRSLL